MLETSYSFLWIICVALNGKVLKNSELDKINGHFACICNFTFTSRTHSTLFAWLWSAELPLFCSAVWVSNSTRKAAFEHISKYIFMRRFPHEFIILASVQHSMLRERRGGGYKKIPGLPPRFGIGLCALLVGERAIFLRATIHILARNLIYYSLFVRWFNCSAATFYSLRQPLLLAKVINEWKAHCARPVYWRSRHGRSQIYWN